MLLSGNTILITGGATGIGFSMAEQLIALGNEVIICGRREERLKEAQAKMPELTTRVCDVAKHEERLALFEWVTKEFKSLNILVNNAGIQRDVDFLNMDNNWSHYAEEITINLEAPIHLSSLFIPHLQQQENAAIINVSSGFAFVPKASFPIYCAIKAAIHSLSLTMRYQLRNTRIEVYEVMPPNVITELNYESRIKRNTVNSGVLATEFTEFVLKGLERGDWEIAYGMAEERRTASHEESIELFKKMNPS